MASELRRVEITPERSAAIAVDLLQAASSYQAQAAALLAEADEADAHIPLGYTSPQRLLEHGAGLSKSLADKIVRVAKHCARHSLTADALEDGFITIEHADLLARLSHALVFEYAEAEYSLIGLAEGRDLAGFERAVQAWRWRVSSGTATDDVERQHKSRFLAIQPDLFGGCRGRFQLDAAGAEVLAAALETSPDPGGALEGPRSRRQRNADALVDMASRYLGHSGSYRGAEWDPEPSGSRIGPKTTVDVVIDLNSFVDDRRVDVEAIRTEFARTGVVPKQVLEQFICDGSIRRHVMDGRSITLDYGTATPIVPVALRKAVQARDGTCRFEGCDRSWAWCDVHHIRPVSRGGPTDLVNLALVCRHHHTLIHQGGWRVEWDPIGRTHVTTSP